LKNSCIFFPRAGNMSLPVYIENYRDKSIVVRGESREYKESLKAMGGKWNSNLTDDSGERFGAWIFWKGKQAEVEKWARNGCPAVSSTSRSPARTSERTSESRSSGNSTTSDLSRRLGAMESQLKEMYKMLGAIAEQCGCKTSATSVEEKPASVSTDEEDTAEPAPRRRLLKKSTHT
jgi:hypothetical protein